jgi:hypothetical protein
MPHTKTALPLVFSASRLKLIERFKASSVTTHLKPEALAKILRPPALRPPDFFHCADPRQP